MAERPLLFFPAPELADRTKKAPPRDHVHKPDRVRQGQRLSPIFNQLQAAIDSRRLEIQQNPAGIDPEQVLVLETIGSIEAFANTVKKYIDGFEWMGELEIDEITPDEDFYDFKKPEKKLSGRLYLVMVNQQALTQVLSLWRRYEADPEMKFERGLTPLRDVFLCLKSIERWDIKHRLLETGIIDIWKENLEIYEDKPIPFEVELWFRGSSELRASSALQVKELIEQEGGRVINQSVIEEIAYHGLLAELPATTVASIIGHSNIELVKCENVMFFRPVGQIIVGVNPPEDDLETSSLEETHTPSGNPVVALFDGLPLTNHSLLTGRLIVDDPDNWTEDYAPSERFHGTTMASLIIHGDLNQPSSPLSRPVYVRPIMKPFPSYQEPRPEGIPEKCLAVDLVHRAVKRLFDDNEGEPPQAPHVKIINLSIGDPSRQFTNSMSPFARLLDWLSIKYRVLFVVSAGNHPSSISLDIPQDKFDPSNTGALEIATIMALYSQAPYRKLLSPAETINGLSIGAVHLDDAQVSHQGDRIDPFGRTLPSPISAFGSGYRRSIKPDMVFYGGRQLYQLPPQPSDPVTIKPATFRQPPGNKAASSGSRSGELNATSYSCGTSNATALISRAACICYDSLQQIFNEQLTGIDLSHYEVPLLKTMLVHGCSWDEIGKNLKYLIKTSGLGSRIKERAESFYTREADISKDIKRQYQSNLARWMGYGLPQIDRVLDCTAQRATLLGCGELSDGEAHVFKLPLPPSLGSRPEWRRLTVTLAWLSPISVNTQKYRTASLWFELSNNSIASTRIDADRHTVTRGTVQHEVFEGTKAEPLIDGTAFEIKVNCRKDAGEILNPVAYGLAVSLEVAEGLDIAIYDEIKTRIATMIRIR